MNPRNNTIVAFFGGTGYDFDHTNKGYVNNQTLGHQESQEHFHTDRSFTSLTQALDNKQRIYGYDGCHRRGGGLFAYGVDEPAEHLYQQIKTEWAENSADKLTVILTAHSRGCLSALLFAKKIAADSELSDKVNIVLDLRDPVPGNLAISASLDLAGISTIAGKLFNLSHCKSVKAAHITVQEKGILDIGFNVLVPKFAPNTNLEIDGLPGLHDIQERENCNDGPANYDEKIKSYEWHNGLYLLGLCKSLQIYLQHGVQISLVRAINIITQTAIHCHESTFEAIKLLLESTHNGKDISSDSLLEVLEKAQATIYQSLLSDYQIYNKRTPLTRNLHFGGKLKKLCPNQSATHLNSRHATLAEKYTEETEAVIPLIGIKGNRDDINIRDTISKRYDQLVHECERYLESAQGDEKRNILKSMLDALNTKKYSIDSMIKNVTKFNQIFSQNQALFNTPDDARFKRNVLHIMISIFTLGIYAAIRGIHSKAKYGTGKFWLSRDGKFTNNTEQLLSDVSVRMKHKNAWQNPG